MCFIACNSSEEEEYKPLTPEEGEELSGGSSTVFNESAEAFGFASKDLTLDESSDFSVGNSFFRQSWVTAPSSTTARDGLGPFFNANACASCHFKDGRGRPPTFEGELGRGLLLRLSLPGINPDGSSFPEPTYGSQLQDNAILGQTIKGKYTITYQTVNETLADGIVIELQKPVYQIINLGYGALAGGVLVSPRVANQIIGMGLLEAVPESTILAFAANNSNGVSGKANYVYDVQSNSQKLGRFGWKANQPSVRQQVAGAFSGDMGITSSVFPNENCPSGVDCSSIPNGGSPEISEANFNRVVLYSSSLAVPVRRNYTSQDVLKGKKIFEEINCTSCHISKMQTGSDYPILGLRNQTIRPYTDLLLHDMGDGLADGAQDFLATGSEWRTQPLWGIGLINTVNGHTRLLHDGRARNVTEAILWHGGEALSSKNKFKQLGATERNQLLAFINSL
ncbi:di-heme oxidoredictase family protein [Flavobacterium sp.]|uniref:di-heme oxidoreductase family protein n=1 Tax=Flavobacterium sp. TaxID=239 RepID=UPI003D6A631B